MSRNDVESTYLAYHVPPDLDRRWLAELTDERLAQLGSRGNWWVLQFLHSHRDVRHLPAVLAAVPLGVLWERIAFAEFRLDYGEMCWKLGCSRADAEAGIDRVIADALRLRSTCRSDRTRKRVDKLIGNAAKTRMAVADSTPP